MRTAVLFAGAFADPAIAAAFAQEFKTQRIEILGGKSMQQWAYHGPWSKARICSKR